MADQYLGFLRCHGELLQRSLGRPCERTSVLRAEESFVARAGKLLLCRIEQHRTREVCATLVEGHELVFGKPQENAWIVFRRISKEFVPSDGNLVDARDGNGRSVASEELLRQFSCRGRARPDQKRQRREAKELCELPSRDITVLGAGYGEVLSPAGWHLQFPHIASSVISGIWSSDSGMNETMSKSS